MSYIQGIDTSVWQGVMDFLKAVAAGARFNISRAGSINNVTGICYPDGQWPNNKFAGKYIPTGYYWFFRPNHDPVRQADFFTGLTKTALPGPLVIDVETQAGLTPEQFAGAIEKFINRVYSNTMQWCTIYTRTTVWNPYSVLVNGVYVPAGVAELPLWSKLKLWIARYGVDVPWVGTTDKYKPRDWNTWTMHQYSADGNNRGPEFGAKSASIDLNWFNGTELEFASYFGLAVPPFPHVPAPDPKVIIRAASGLNIRETPGGTKIGSAYNGSRWDLIDRKPVSGIEYDLIAGWVHGGYTEDA